LYTDGKSSILPKPFNVYVLMKRYTRLTEIGLIISAKKGETFVRRFSDDELVAAYDIREYLEGLSARSAAESAQPPEIQKMEEFFAPFQIPIKEAEVKDYLKADMRFHEFVAGLSNPILCEIFQRSVLQFCLLRCFRSYDLSFKEHLNIIAAIRDHNPDLAEKLMRSHIRVTRDEIARSIQQAQFRIGESQT
jgi:DNA-binding GntR family transcriptional regulator